MTGHLLEPYLAHAPAARQLQSLGDAEYHGVGGNVGGNAPDVPAEAVRGYGDDHQPGVAQGFLRVVLDGQGFGKRHSGQPARMLAGGSQRLRLVGSAADETHGRAGAGRQDGQGRAPGGCAEDGDGGIGSRGQGRLFE